ncbi:uncharacterized protein LOC110856651 [Folsomia candida]|uniref:F-box domain-containing protein n=1 Tax=Folsomia candida TaxID=158441 RepID=A0A226F5J4_FOLCA|nr:uncharacterized protein LOC110856651 [Folsomia candida]OXA64451.1 hypothetical protein Fcan01_03902 [Folsomia candida]
MARVPDITDKNRDQIMLRRPAFSPKGRSFKGFNLKKGLVDTNAARSRALKNPLVLDLIFGNLGLPDLKTSRLVCREWADVGAIVLGKRAFLQVNQLFSCEWFKPVEMAPVNDKLIRRVLISDKFDSSIPTYMKTGVITIALTQVAKLSQLTREIKFLVSQKEFVPAFLEGIRILGSTKIQHVGIFSAWKRDIASTIPAEACQNLPPQPSLTSLKFEALSHLQHDLITGCNEFQPLIQVWLDAAPNLTSLDVVTSFYPNLEACTSLRVLKFKLIMCCNEHYPHLNLANVTKMLAQVKDSLVKLELCHRVNDYDSMQQIQSAEEVPVMSKLTSFAIDAGEVYQVRDFYNEEHFPKLRSFSVQKGLKLFSHLNLWSRHRGVHSLVLIIDYVSEEQEFVGKMVDLFPAVKEFDLRLDLTVLTFTGDMTTTMFYYEPSWTSAAIHQFMKPFQMWDLERVNVSVEVQESALLIDALQAISVLKGVKRVQFCFPCKDNTMDNFSATFQDVILHCRTFKSVEITRSEFRVEPEIVEQMQLMIEASGCAHLFYRKK